MCFNLTFRVRHLPVKHQQNVPVSLKKYPNHTFYTQHQCWDLKGRAAVPQLLVEYREKFSDYITSTPIWIIFAYLNCIFSSYICPVCPCIAHCDDERSTDYISILFAYKQIHWQLFRRSLPNALAFYHCASVYLELLLKALKYLTC